MIRSRVFVTLLFTAASLSRAGAQQPESIPADLARALLRWAPTPEQEPELHVGKAGPSILPELVPAGARVLGSLTGASSTVLVVGVAGQPDSVSDAYQALLTQRGWQAPSQTLRAGGFQISAATAMIPRALCRDSAVVLFVPLQAGAETHLRVDYRKTGPGPMCGEQSSDRGSRRMSELIPPLRLPAGAAATGQRAGGGMNERHSALLLRSDLGSPQLLTHYADELRKASWAVELLGQGSGLQSARVRFTDGERNEWVGVLSVLDLSTPGIREVALRIRRADATPWNQ